MIAKLFIIIDILVASLVGASPINNDTSELEQQSIGSPLQKLETFMTNVKSKHIQSTNENMDLLNSFAALNPQETADGLIQWANTYRTANTHSVEDATKLVLDCIIENKCGNAIFSSSNSSNSSIVTQEDDVYERTGGFGLSHFFMLILHEILHIVSHAIAHGLMHKHPHGHVPTHIFCDEQVQCLKGVFWDVDRYDFMKKRLGLWPSLWEKMTSIERSALVYAVSHPDDLQSLIQPIENNMGKSNARAMVEAALYVFGWETFHLRTLNALNGEYDMSHWPPKLHDKYGFCKRCTVENPHE